MNYGTDWSLSRVAGQRDKIATRNDEQISTPGLSLQSSQSSPIIHSVAYAHTGRLGGGIAFSLLRVPFS